MSSLTAMVLAGLMASAPAERLAVPVELQADLLAKVVRYDRNFAGRAGPQARVLVVYAPESPESERVARELMAALKARAAMGGVAHGDELVPFVSAAQLVKLAKDRRASLVVFAPGLASQSAAIGLAFTDYDGLTVSTTSEGVREGLTLGFDLRSGKPHMLLNLAQARRQHVDFRAEVLQLMTVFP